MIRRGQAGFTLLEVMVAVAILGVGLTAIVGGIAMCVRSTALAAGYERSRAVADNQLSRFVAGRPQGTAKLQGVDDGVRWQLRADKDSEREGLLHVVIEARFYAAGGERTLAFETRELIRAGQGKAQTRNAGWNIYRSGQ